MQCPVFPQTVHCEVPTVGMRFIRHALKVDLRALDGTLSDPHNSPGLNKSPRIQVRTQRRLMGMNTRPSFMSDPIRRGVSVEHKEVIPVPQCKVRD